MIFSSRGIPGNEKAIGRVINGMIDQGIEVITDRTHLVHVSGHPRVAELEDMYRWVRPQIAVPVHGEALHLSEHAKIARRCGVAAMSCAAHNGDRRPARAGPCQVRRRRGAFRRSSTYKDGRLMIAADDRDGRRPQAARASAALFAVSIAIDDKGELLADPEVELLGVFRKRNASDGVGSRTSVLRGGRRRYVGKPLPRWPARRDPDTVP